ncbi:hypothetical protein IF2G_00445 [Cordyceps javanica]|nr:hypothetical protein IF2G_00445 [Cordyceps javanica]
MDLRHGLVSGLSDPCYVSKGLPRRINTVSSVDNVSSYDVHLPPRCFLFRGFSSSFFLFFCGFSYENGLTCVMP